MAEQQVEEGVRVQVPDPESADQRYPDGVPLSVNTDSPVGEKPARKPARKRAAKKSAAKKAVATPTGQSADRTEES